MILTRLLPLLASATIMALTGVTLRAEADVILQNDGFVDGQAVGFQSGFAVGEIGASRLLPVGTGPWRVTRVLFLYGGAAGTRTITLRIWDDTAGTGSPGTQLFSADYSVTASNTVLQEINLIGDDVQVPGQFRVGIEFQNGGTPSIARDDDGTINQARNFIYTPSGPGWFQSSLFGITGDWIIRAGVDDLGGSGGGGNPPSITSIDDIGNDQGRQVRISFARSAQDQSGAITPILQYEVLRRIDPLPMTVSPVMAAAHEALLMPLSPALGGWDYVASLPAHGETSYSLVVPTLADSSVANGIHMSTFLVRAATASPLTFYDSAPESGYSVDNLPPAPPSSFAADYQYGITSLAWNPNSEPDLWYYRLHRGDVPNFVPGPGNLVANTSDTAFDDGGPWGGHYKLAAVDVNGNVGRYALVTPQATTGVPGSNAGTALALAIRTRGPNPSRVDQIVVSLALPVNAPATLELLDVTGRRVLSREVGELGVGEHAVALEPGRNLVAGVYLIRLSQGRETRVTRVTIVP